MKTNRGNDGHQDLFFIKHPKLIFSALILTFSAGQEMFKVMARPKVMQIWALSIITFYAKKSRSEYD